MKKNLPSTEQRALEEKAAPIQLPEEVTNDLGREDSKATATRAYIADPLFEEFPQTASAVPESAALPLDSDTEPGTETQETTVPKPVSILEEVAQKQQASTEQARSAYQTQKDRLRSRQRDKRMSAVKRYGLILFIILSLLALIYFLPAFHVQKFQVDGIQNLSEQDVITVSGIKQGEHLLKGWGGGLLRILTLRNGAAEDRIKAQFPYVDSVKVNAKFPGTAHIEVLERVPVSYIDYQGKVVLLDKDGIILDIRSLLTKEIPIIYNAKLQDPVPGEMVSDEVKKTLRPAILVLDALINNDVRADDGFSFFSQVKSITLTDGAETYITLSQAYASPDTRIKLGNRQTLDESINWLRYAARTDNLLNLGRGTLDITGTRKYFYPTNDEN